MIFHSKLLVYQRVHIHSCPFCLDSHYVLPLAVSILPMGSYGYMPRHAKTITQAFEDGSILMADIQWLLSSPLW